MSKLGEFGEFSAKFSQHADFLFVYTAEAHPAEEANFTGNISISAHQQLADRERAAGVLRERLGSQMEVPIVLDSMKDLASSAYCSLPERLYIVLDGRVSFEGEPGPLGYSVEAARRHLQTLLADKKTQ